MKKKLFILMFILCVVPALAKEQPSKIVLTEETEPVVMEVQAPDMSTRDSKTSKEKKFFQWFKKKDKSSNVELGKDVDVIEPDKVKIKKAVKSKAVKKK